MSRPVSRRPSRPSRPWLVVLAAALAATPTAAQTRHLEGHVAFRGDALPVRLHLPVAGDTVGRLDLPTLWYAGEPTRVVVGDDGALEVDVPFGLGRFRLEEVAGGFRVGAGDLGFATLGPGAPPPYDTIAVTFGTDGEPLHGTLYVPKGQGPVPAVVVVAGSGPTTRAAWAYRSKADYYARLGVAALVYDRRSYADTLPDGRPVDFRSHAADLDAARRVLAAHPRVDGGAVGLHGGSQGAWLAVLAQGEHGGFRFLVLTGAPAVTPAEQQVQSVVQGMRDDGLSDEEVADAVAYHRLYFHVARTGTEWDALVAAGAAAEGTTWGEYVDRPREPAELAWWRRHMDHDPRSHLVTMDVPMLVMWGERDWVVPPAMNRGLFERYAAIAGNEVVTMVAPGADHRLERGPGPDASGRWRFFEIAREAREAIPDFLRATVGLGLTPPEGGGD